MPSQHIAQEGVDPTRTCVVCSEEKPVSGVWYLLPPGRVERTAPFVCESCYKQQALAPSA